MLSSYNAGNYHLNVQLRKKINEPRTTRIESPETIQTDNQRSEKIARLIIQKHFTYFENTKYYQMEQIDAEDITRFKITVYPKEGIYSDGIFEFLAQFPLNYPYDPPKVTCLTQVYHPNIDLEGHVCLSILKTVGYNCWSPVRTFEDLTNGLQTLEKSRLLRIICRRQFYVIYNTF